MSKPNMLAALEKISDSEPSSSGSEAEEDAQDTKKQKKEITVEDLMNKGYKSGPSVMGVKPPKEEDPPNWSWSSGTKQKAMEGEETIEERRATHQAATAGVETSAIYTQAALNQAAKIREERRLEQERLAESKRLSWKDKEKRKRDEGKQSRGKNYVEEEKRLARSYGYGAGFD
uniref:Uncharacterized protein n=1 Tax=Dunaliella tertiolecta TaxID=3047 RepID=A0A7S3QK56_DUNTE|mmetsp:Transcript_6797/g.18254  ORF Transcript_6797/g.18254 Transcript_6797/m.18254 type:complete len:174 (-) Transcript_6797:654-1175(-)